jgi:hypothetical protein
VRRGRGEREEEKKGIKKEKERIENKDNKTRNESKDTYPTP